MHVSLQNLFGLAILVGIITMIFIACANFKMQVKLTYPAIKKVYEKIAKEISKE